MMAFPDRRARCFDYNKDRGGEVVISEQVVDGPADKRHGGSGRTGVKRTGGGSWSK